MKFPAAERKDGKMECRKVWAVFFSPAGTTKRCVTRLARHLADALGAAYSEYDFSLPKMRESAPVFEADELVVFGTPVYAGRIPNKLLDYVSSVKGSRTPAVPVVLYGNRSFQDGLSELRSVLAGNGFIPVGAAAFVSRHAMSETLAAGRPSAEDLRKADLFAEELAGEIHKREDWKGISLAVPGNDPVGPYYRPLQENGTPAMFLKAKPKTKESCTGCGICAANCPMGSISAENCKTVTGVCIKCHACVRNCPVSAKYFDDESLASHIRYLEQHYRDIKREPEFFR